MTVLAQYDDYSNAGFRPNVTLGIASYIGSWAGRFSICRNVARPGLRLRRGVKQHLAQHVNGNLLITTSSLLPRQ